MTIGEVLLIVVAFFLVASILIVEWIRCEKNKSGLNRNIQRQIFRPRSTYKKRNK